MFGHIFFSVYITWYSTIRHSIELTSAIYFINHVTSQTRIRTIYCFNWKTTQSPIIVLKTQLNTTYFMIKPRHEILAKKILYYEYVIINQIITNVRYEISRHICMIRSLWPRMIVNPHIVNALFFIRAFLLFIKPQNCKQ